MNNNWRVFVDVLIESYWRVKKPTSVLEWLSQAHPASLMGIRAALLSPQHAIPKKRKRRRYTANPRQQPSGRKTQRNPLWLRRLKRVRLLMLTLTRILWLLNLAFIAIFPAVFWVFGTAITAISWKLPLVVYGNW